MIDKKTRIRILHIANGDDCLGSAQCLYEILRYELNQDYLEPVVLTPKHTGMNDFCNQSGIENYAVKFCEFLYPMHDKTAKLKYELRKAEYYINRKKSLDSIISHIDFEKIGIIHTNNSLNDIGKRLGIVTNTPHVWHLREGGLYQQNLHPYFADFADYMSDSNSRFIAVSNAVKTEWIKLGIPEKQITVIYDGVALPDEQHTKTRADKIRFVMTGSYSEIKGQIQVIKATAILPPNYKDKIQIDFWGNGVPEYVEYLENEIKRNKLENVVKLKGFSNNVWKTLSNYDIGLNCTRLEAFGRTTVEFLISGMPVIASNLGANMELINDSNGVFYDYGNTEELKKALMFMVDNFYKYKSNQIADYAREHYSCEISNRKITDFFINIYEGTEQ